MASPFASRVTSTIPVDFDPPNTVTIQKLAGRHLERAQIVAQVRFMENLDERGGPEKQKRMMELFAGVKVPDADTPAPKDNPSPVENPLAGLDPYTLCRFGIKAWTYEESLQESPETKRVDALDDLDEDALLWFATEVMRLSKPSLFKTKAEREDDEKNDSRPSLTDSKG